MSENPVVQVLEFVFRGFWTFAGVWFLTVSWLALFTPFVTFKGERDK